MGACVCVCVCAAAGGGGCEMHLVVVGGMQVVRGGVGVARCNLLLYVRVDGCVLGGSVGLSCCMRACASGLSRLS